MKQFIYRGVKVYYRTTKENAKSFLNTQFTDNGIYYGDKFRVESIHEIEDSFYIYKINNKPNYIVPTEDGVLFESPSFDTAAEYLSVFVCDNSPWLTINGIGVIADSPISFEIGRLFIENNKDVRTDWIRVFMGEVLYYDNTLERYVCPTFPQCTNIVDWYDMADYIYNHKTLKGDK